VRHARGLWEEEPPRREKKRAHHSTLPYYSGPQLSGRLAGRRKAGEALMRGIRPLTGPINDERRNPRRLEEVRARSRSTPARCAAVEVGPP
jgi:hypothetical protein